MSWLARRLTAALLLLAAGRAHADVGAPSASRTAVAPRGVEIRVLGDDNALARVRATAVDLFSHLDVELIVVTDTEITPNVPGENLLVLARVDLRVPTSPVVDVSDGRTRQALMSRSLPDVSSLETGVEAAVHVVYASVDALLQLTAVERPKPQIAATPRRAAPRPRRGTGIDVGALFRLVSLGDSRMIPGAGAAIDVRTDAGPLQAELAVMGALHTATELEFREGKAALRPYALRLLPGVSVPLATRLLGTASVGFGLDHFVIDGRTAPSGGGSYDEAIWDPVLASQLGLRFPLGGAWFMSVVGTLDVDLAPTRFVVDRGATNEGLFALPRLRGGLLLVTSLSPTAVWRFAARGEQP